MTIRSSMCVLKSIAGMLRMTLFSTFVMAAPLFGQMSAHEHNPPAQLVQDVRNATQQFLDVNNAGPAGYGPAFGCVAVRTTARWAFIT